MGRVVLPWACVFALITLPVVGCSEENTGGAGGSAGTRGDGGAGGSAGDDMPRPGDSGDIAGVVFTPNGTAFDVLPGAVLTIVDGPSATADGLGRFLLEDVDAGVPVIVRVEGPPVTNPDDLDVFSTAELMVTVPRDDRVDLFPVLLRGCVGYIDASAGGTATLDECGGAGSGAVTLSAGALETAGGDAFTGVVRLEVAIVDPLDPLDRAAVPLEPPPLVDLVLGAIEVRLLDSATLAPLSLAEGQSATVRVSLDEVPEGSSDDDIELSTYDEGLHAWVDEPAGTVVDNGDGRFYEFAATHFTRFMEGLNPPERRQRCVTAVPGVCRSGSCDCSIDPCDRVPTNVLVSDRRRATQQVMGTRLESCILVTSDSPATFFFWAMTETGELRTGIVGVGSTLTGATHEDCCAERTPFPRDDVCDCLDLGFVTLEAPLLGCVEGLLQTPSGPLSGPIDVLVGGQRIGQTTADTDGTFCGDLPVQFGNPETDLVFTDGRGNEVSITPDTRSSGQTCAGASCQQFGTQTTSCNLAGTCAEAAFTTELVDDFAQCSSAGGFQSDCETCLGVVDTSYLLVDGTSSQGQIQKYTWGVAQLAPVESPLIPGGSAERVTAGFCLGPGQYRVRLVTWSELRVGRRDSADAFFSVGLPWPGPCSGEVTEDTTMFGVSGTVTYTYDGFDLMSIADDRNVGGLSIDFVEHFSTTEMNVDGVDVPAGTLLEVERSGGGFLETYLYYAPDHSDIAALAHPAFYVREVIHGNLGGPVLRTDRYSYAPATPTVGATAIECTKWICNTGDVTKCEGPTPEVAPIEQTQTLDFNENGQLVQSGVGTVYNYTADTPTKFHELVCARPFSHPRPIAYPLDTQIFAPTVTDFTYDGSNNLIEVETGARGETVVWTYLYDCWQP